ncbi:GYD domain-containing protein [Actinomycetospora endophytica]|uniref:GYD domain-containing protein n=1 Tax=Actinomycetospora endophytica TaxID=2291215 RepID=A0ABS8PEL6_9PSEU|nr:GYD domain-containing protein [Actinomycetospora endophytica]MCD2196707.1 GYD domain-containing protein [Actinomycetospora endophytica]
MAKFVAFFSYTTDAWQKMQANPGDRPAAIGAVIERLGGTLVSVHFMLGPHDGMVVTDLPDAAAAAAMSTVAMCTGAFRELQTHALLDPGEMPHVFELSRTEGAVYTAPGA